MKTPLSCSSTLLFVKISIVTGISFHFFQEALEKRATQIQHFSLFTTVNLPDTDMRTLLMV